jgi:hypothetical protein
MTSTHTASQLNSQARSSWSCGFVSVSEQGYECFEPADKEVIQWLKSELLQRISSADSASLGSDCYHLKGRGGIKRALRDLSSHLSSGRYPYIIRSDAKGYYAHIRHHKLVALLKDHEFSREVCHVTTQLCQRMTVRGGIYSECHQGIPLGCAASPALAAIYLSPLDHAMAEIPGVRYIRYMDDWVILCPSRWKMRRALKTMHQELNALGLSVHPDKTFIGKVSKGFDFLGVQFDLGKQSPSNVSRDRLNTRLTQKFTHAARLYEQGRLRSLKSIELYLTHWLRYQKGIGIASSAAIKTLYQTLQCLCSRATDVMIPTFSKMLITTFLNKQQNKENKENENTHIKKSVVPVSSKLRNLVNVIPEQRCCHC